MSDSEFKSFDEYSVDVDGIFLVSADGSKPLDIKNFVISLSIVEDILNPFISCHIVVMDFDDIAASYPLIGQEYLIVNFTKKKGGVYRQSSFTFLLYSQTKGGVGENNKFQGYVLNGVTIERFRDKSLSFSRSFHDTYSGMISKIFDLYLKNTGKELFVEPTQSVQKYISPFISPLEAIEVIRKKSVSKKEPYTPFLFFQNQERFVFSSYNTLFSNSLSDPNAKKVHYYSNSLHPNPADRSASPLASQVVDTDSINDILSVSILNKYDTVKLMDNNTFSSTAFLFDLTTKSYRRPSYKLSSKENSFNFGNPGRFLKNSFTNELENRGSPGSYYVTDVIGRYSDGSAKDPFPEAVSSMMSYLEIATHERVVVNLYGDNNFKAGDAIKLGIVGIQYDDDTLQLEPTLSGSYLISTVRHMITFDSQPRYVVSLECLKGNYLKDIEER